ncbi:tripartite tricarboxylate transporter permease [Salibacterium halotolerans]|uniref:Putative tricarboxylic transport membrane protein n=1 Tax=Salibacterium halotolerans TaxID=1884432 RepID=A0A1I5RMT2_9BACI|nr:tripartite tricarboxylate transporter permease [Salibacterium halotolerans]SFP59845.1 putative tricarboxylic transport membrane protein [Salibacterium halotolerans]
MGVDFQNVLEGLMVSIRPINLLWVLLGGLLGTVVGMLPGLGPATAVAVLIPITFGMDPTSALILMAAIYYGAMYGGSRSSILLNTPGDGSAIAATFDGYPMTQKGQAGQALTISAISSLIGGLCAIAGFILLAKPLASFALRFGPAEYFMLMLFTLSAIVSLSKGNMVKGFISMSIGLILSTVGIDLQTGVYRFTFDIPQLSEGIDFLVVIIGIYAVGEVLFNFINIDSIIPSNNKIGKKWITKDQWKKIKWPVIRSGPLGFIVGVLPGAGGSIASMLGYTTERQLAKRPQTFGKGDPAGLAAPESANNAGSVGAFIPLLTMGVPGSGTTAVILGAVIMLGLRPGPLLFENNPDMVWTMVNSMFIGNIFLVIINILLIGVLVRILNTPPKILYPLILVLAFIGTYTLSYSMIDFYILVIFGLVGLIMKLMDFPIAPLILAVIVGSDMEQNFRKGLVAHDNPFNMLSASSVSIVLTIMTILSVLYPFFIDWIQKRKQKKV